MANLLLFTLGTGAYQETTYAYGDGHFKTRFAACALRAFFEQRGVALDRAIVWVTPEAHVSNLAALQAAWEGGSCPLETRDLATPSGDSEFWDLFDGLAAEVSDGDRVLPDVTHGFRSMPIVAVLAIAYLRAVRRDVAIEMVGYGQWTKDVEPTPYLDLLPLVSLLDWTHGVQRLRESGDARPFMVVASAGRGRRAPGGGRRRSATHRSRPASFDTKVLALLDQADLRAKWRASPHHDLVAPFAEKVGVLRNALMHAGFSVNEGPEVGSKVVAALAGFHTTAMDLPIWDAIVSVRASAAQVG